MWKWKCENHTTFGPHLDVQPHYHYHYHSTTPCTTTTTNSYTNTTTRTTATATTASATAAAETTTTTTITTTTTTLQLELQLQLQLQLHYTTLHYRHNYNYTYATTKTTTTASLHYSPPHYIQWWVRWPLQPLQKAQLQPPVGPSVSSAIHASQQLTSPIVSYLWNFRHVNLIYYCYYSSKPT